MRWPFHGRKKSSSDASRRRTMNHHSSQKNEDPRPACSSTAAAATAATPTIQPAARSRKDRVGGVVAGAAPAGIAGSGAATVVGAEVARSELIVVPRRELAAGAAPGEGTNNRPRQRTASE